MGDPAVYPANTCADIQGTENRYTSFVNVPGILDIEIESIRAIYNKDLGDYDLKVKVGRQNLTQYSQWDTMVELTMHMKWHLLLKTIQLSQHVVDIELSNKSMICMGCGCFLYERR